MNAVRIGLIGDYAAGVVAHQAIERAMRLAASVSTRPVVGEWVPTTEIRDAQRIRAFDGLWGVPATPYRSTDGALCAIRFAREQGRPFLGTCGGFQYAIVEYARHVLGWADAEHAETAPEASRPVIAPLSCSLVEVTGTIVFRPGSMLAAAYGSPRSTEGYHCRYGLNPAFRAQLAAGALRVAAEDEAGDVRAVELHDHPFYVATLFQPERAALTDRLPPIVAAFVQAAAQPDRVNR